MIRGIHVSGRLVRNRFVLRTIPRRISILLNQNGTLAKDGLMRQENVLGKAQPSETLLRDGIRVQSRRSYVRPGFAFGRLGVTITQAP